MTHKFPVPAEAQVEKLIVSVYERLPVAEITRLNQLEERLTRKLLMKKPEHKVNTLPWWIVLLLAGGFAVAAWHIGEIWIGKSESQIVNEVNRPSDTVIRNNSGDNDSASDSNPASQTGNDEIRKDKSPVIYGRENF